MATDKQIAANRENAKHCTGPRTEAGKAKSSQNAFKTGIDAKSEVMPCESQAEYDELIANFRIFYAPFNPEESSLVDSLIRHEWLSRRYICVEASCWDQGSFDMDTRSLGSVFLRHSQAISRANRLFNASRRAFAATLKELRESQARRLSQPLEIPAEPSLENAAPETSDSAQPTQTAHPAELPETQPHPAPDPAPEQANSETPALEPKPLNPELVSFLPISQQPSTPPADDREKEINPRIAA